MKKTLTMILVFTVFLLTACEEEPSLNNIDDSIDYTDTSEEYTEEEITDIIDQVVNEVTIDGFSLDDYYQVDGNEEYLTVINNEITESGIYYLEGTYTETITINTPDEDVQLILDNVTISVESGPAILVIDADEVTITSPLDTNNTIEDTNVHPMVDTDDYNAAIYSFVDLIINGPGTLNVIGNYNNAINTKDDLKILETNLIIESVDDGIIGRDYIAVKEATITVVSDGDAIKSTNDESTDKGFIYIESGTFNITSNSDGFEAVNDIYIYGGEFNIDTKDDGISSATNIYIGGGLITIESDSDAINSTKSINILDGEINISCYDDGIHADESITIDGGTINVYTSYEGIESYEIYINGGSVNIISSDDGINATVGGGQEHGPQYVSLGGYLEINGGIIYVISESDGVDVNGSIVMNDGYLIVFGSSYDNQSSIDFDDTFEVHGGLLVAVGSVGMIQSVSVTSSQPSLTFTETANYGYGDTISLLNSYGETIVEVTAPKAFAGIVISSPLMETSSSYTLQIDEDEYEFEITSLITYLGSGGIPTSSPQRPGR